MSTATLDKSLDNSAQLLVIARNGIKYKLFEEIMKASPFSMKEWSRYLHLTERTIQRYKNENKSFEIIQSEKIIELSKMLKKGNEVFGNTDNFKKWLNTEIIAIGGVMPKDILDSSFGIDMVMDELGRIEHGILA